MSTQEAGNLSLEDRTTNFPKLMQQLDGGVISNVVGLALSNVARAVSYSDKQGNVKIDLKLKPMGTNNEMVEITVNMSVKEPKTGFGTKSEDFQYTSIAYVGKGGKLTYDRPKEDIRGQLVIEDAKLREVRG
ncbi:hypothetical protein BOO29_10880 [Vibrio navarrensis]|uniref:hypothetical protein n=1 Tax=Vibrio TaxID=662 RepID=UPI00052CE7F3|nr:MULTISPECIES: hypothetical protein [Vibrio]AUL97458.1 hypothetical protein FORC54_3313 [Vibrio vulnificus]EIO2324608.1 hypothetical protein [Vibrio vulnificus]KGK23201.1 hypothetical protein DC58_05795 [Vibrio navarrensis]MBE3670964.1 hypothetical protein [Vibrio navarrensis]MBE4585465.1 hypothetical protein [Vibrio navarrensis]